MSELGKYSPQHRGGLAAGDTASVDLTPENHGPHRMNRKQTANDYKNAFKVPQLLFLTRQNLSNSYPKYCNMCLTSDAVYRIRDADAIFRIERKDGQKIAKNSQLFYTKYGYFTSNRFERHFFLHMFQTFYRRFYQNTTNHVMGSRARLITTNHDMRPIRF